MIFSFSVAAGSRRDAPFLLHPYMVMLCITYDLRPEYAEPKISDSPHTTAGSG